ncbi:alpha/beta hydrolase [Streptomyces bathyalis]|uniref:Alpha/beta hydrolase n=2 Tax=Streptomyces bathyalis TaxID=2710756 RepID=A0A7T1WX14_9ACTN|nr:alpha/beta hydrolase [Streptomyces bathyalis]
MLAITAAVVVVTVLTAAFALRTPSPVGHWNSAQAQQEFLRDYKAAMEDMPEPDRTLDVRTRFGFVRVYKFEGTGRDDVDPLVLLPGRSSPTPVWADNMPSLLKVADVYAVDLLGEPGMSVQEAPIATDADNAAWLDRTLAALPEEKFNVLGLSIGGWTATNLAVHHPERINALMLIDPVYTFSGMPAETAVRAIPASVPWLPKSWRDSFNSYTAGGAPVEDVPLARMTETAMSTYAIKLPQPTLISEDDLAGLKMPVLAILAGDSVMHDIDASRQVAERRLRNGTVVVHEDASHAVGSEQPEDIARQVREFLAAP